MNWETAESLMGLFGTDGFDCRVIEEQLRGLLNKCATSVVSQKCRYNKTYVPLHDKSYNINVREKLSDKDQPKHLVPSLSRVFSLSSIGDRSPIFKHPDRKKTNAKDVWLSA